MMTALAEARIQRELRKSEIITLAKNFLNCNKKNWQMTNMFKRIRVASGPFGKSTFFLNYPRPQASILNPTRVRGTRRSFGPQPARVSVGP